MITLPRTKHSQSHKESQPRKWLSTKNRSPWRSTPRHPIVMSSTAKTPDPMSCALAAVLLPELRAHGCHMQKTLFPAPHARWGVCARPVPACRVHSCGEGGRRESDRRSGCQEAVPGTVGSRRPLVCDWVRRGGVRACGHVVGRSSQCLPAVWSRACVDTWDGAASGGSFKTVAPVAVWGLGLLLRGTLVDYRNAPDNAYSQGGQELNASAGSC
jgi:hypothetical protein